PELGGHRRKHAAPGHAHRTLLPREIRQRRSLQPPTLAAQRRRRHASDWLSSGAQPGSDRTPNAAGRSILAGLRRRRLLPRLQDRARRLWCIDTVWNLRWPAREADREGKDRWRRARIGQPWVDRIERARHFTLDDGRVAHVEGEQAAAMLNRADAVQAQ